MKLYKLTDQDMRTHGGYQWSLGVWHKTSGWGDLCGPGWLHAYADPLVALFLNPIHTNIPNPRLFEAEGDGAFRDDNGLKCGVTRLRLTEELPVPTVTIEQRVRFAIGCALTVYTEPSFVAWANGWLSGSDRTAVSSQAEAAWESEAVAVDLPAIAAWAMTDAPWPQ